MDGLAEGVPQIGDGYLQYETLPKTFGGASRKGSNLIFFLLTNSLVGHYFLISQ